MPIDVPEVILGAGDMGVFAFSMLGMGWQIIRSQQKFIYNHLSEGTKALNDVVKSNEAVEKALDRLADKL